MLRKLLLGGVALLGLLSVSSGANAAAFVEGFNNLSPANQIYQPAGWSTINRSQNASISQIGYWYPSTFFQQPVPAFEGNTAIGVSGADSSQFLTGPNTLSVWLISPVATWENGDTIKFHTRSLNPAGPPQDVYPDRMQVRLSGAGNSLNVGTTPESVGDFSKLLLDINPTLSKVSPDAYPVVWTQYSITVSGLSAPTSGRMAFRYYVTNGSLEGENSTAIFVDNLIVTGVPEPSGAVAILAVGRILWRRRRTTSV